MSMKKRGHWIHHWTRNTVSRRWGVRIGEDSLYYHAPEELLVWRAMACWIWLAGHCYFIRTPFYPSKLRAS
jgi:hypothetical protein